VVPDASEEEVTSWLRLGLFGDTAKGWLGMPMNELTTVGAYHSATVRWIAWLAGPKGPAVRQAIGEVFKPSSSKAPSLDALTLAHDQLLQDGAQDGGDVPHVPTGAQIEGPILIPLDEIREAIRCAAPQPPGGARTSLFASQATLYKVVLKKHGPETRLVSPLPAQVLALAASRERKTIPLAPGANDTESSASMKELCKEFTDISFTSCPMNVFAAIGYRTDVNLTINREEFGYILCMWLGTELACCVGAPPCVGCGMPVDPGGHHFMTCKQRAAFYASHTLLQATISAISSIPGSTVSKSTRRQGLPHEKPVGGKKGDLCITVVHAPTAAGARLHSRVAMGGHVLDANVTHPCDGKGILKHDALGASAKAKNTKHAEWLKLRGYEFTPIVCSTLGAVTDDSLRFTLMCAWLRADAQNVSASATAGADARGPLKSVEQRRGEIFARHRTALVLTSLRGSGVRLSGKHWDRGMTAVQRRDMAAREAADIEEERAALAPALPVVVHAYPVA
jgi:hypothetical protein